MHTNQCPNCSRQRCKPTATRGIYECQRCGSRFGRELLIAAELKGRGWTPAMIRDLLGEPDNTYPNPHSLKAGPVRLWAKARVDEAESRPGFAQRRDAAERRSNSAVSVADRKRDELIAALETMPAPKVPVLPHERLLREAVQSYNTLERTERMGSYASTDADHEFLDRICVNYIRHQLSDYEADLYAVAGKIGVREARDLIRERIYDAIADAYPDLEAECSRQLDRRRYLD